MTTLKWGSYGSVTSYLSTELNSLADGGNILGASIDNSTNLNLFADVEIALASLTPGTNPYVNIFLIQSLDGTNFEDGDGSNDPPPAAQKYTRGLLTGAAAKRVIIPRIMLPPGLFKLMFENRAGVALAASGNTVKYSAYSQQAV